MNYKEKMHSLVYKAFERKHKERTPEEIRRLDVEMEIFYTLGWHEPFLLMHSLVKICRSKKRKSSTSLDSSFVAYLLNMTRYNPLSLESLNISKDYDADKPLWIRVSADLTQTLSHSLLSQVNGDAIESETLRGSAYVLHPTHGGGNDFRIYASILYTLMDEVNIPQKIGIDYDLQRERDLNFGYIPGFFTELEEYELRNSKVKNLTQLTNLLQQMRQLNKIQALYFAMDYLEAGAILKKSPETWFAAFLSQQQSRNYFDFQTMGCGAETCIRAMRRNRERMYFTDSFTSSKASAKNDVYRACEAAYNRGVTFLASDIQKSHPLRFLVSSNRALQVPLVKACTLITK